VGDEGNKMSAWPFSILGEREVGSDFRPDLAEVFHYTHGQVFKSIAEHRRVAILPKSATNVIVSGQKVLRINGSASMER
jgi:hypothetical protein